MTGGTVLLALGLSVATALAWRRRSWGPAAGFGAGAVLFVSAGVRWLAEQVTWTGLLLIVGVVGLLVWHRWSRTAGSLGRWNRRSRRKSGVASGVDILRVRRRVRGLAMTVRPSLSALSRWQRAVMPSATVGVRICRVGPLWVWSSCEGVVVVIGGPRYGKTAALTDQILDAPGAVLVTSTKTDLYHQVGPLRRRTGPVVVFNPAGLGGVVSTIGFDPLSGCEQPVTAAERATDMIPPSQGAGGSGDREHWNDQARRVLAGLLHAAALGGHTMRDVLRWVADPQQAGREVPPLLRRAGDPAFEQDVLQFFDTNDRTRTSITTSIMPALGWLTHGPAAAAGRPGAVFDVEWLLRSRATVFLLGARDARTTALMCALTGHIAREARRLAEVMPGGRLDPPLRMALDEATQICPVPLPEWTSDMGGRGITIMVACQSRAQLINTYGPQGAAATLTNADTTVVFGGCSDRDDLMHWSTLVGERDEWVTSTDAHGRGTHRNLRRVPVLQAAQIAALPKHRVLVLTSGCPPVLGWARKGWRRRDVRALAAHRARCKRLHERIGPVPAVRVTVGRWIERALAAAAGRWPDHVGERAGRRHEYNAMRERLDLARPRALPGPARSGRWARRWAR
ncbi:type IV secretory system conjugative DNA transfer family protein [Pseudonocardia sp. KRD291]|uniref:type IV secretory system conjugative DNA transfer family protein n=1 Tax=Pseudonocardia sp. KRD291 TaxID=2792007 RepID=UPI001C4A6FA6|nr:type IV secretory system conjugative DNA transfer family protein [Pseudonocardia sp. KRD291]MBW0101641.1 TraM recognition domain-containing protein [Pseudonocardia sp. KRD291]